MQDRFFRLLLWVLPQEFRHAYARDLEVTFRTERRVATSHARLFGLWVATVADVLRAAPSQHLDVVQRDLRFAWRAMVARPLHTATATLTLALGVGAAISMFAVIDAVWLRPLPYRDPGQLVMVREVAKGGEPSNLGYLTFVDLRTRSRTLQSTAAATRSSATLVGDGRDAERVNVMRVSASYFDLIGVQPVLGRAFNDAEDRPGAARRVLVLSDRIWRRRFASDRSVVNRPIQVNGVQYTIVGVMPAGFNDLVASRLHEGAEMWSPLGYDPAASFACRTCRHLSVFGRLAPEATASDAGRELSSVIGSLALDHPRDYHEPRVTVTGFRDIFFGDIAPVLAVLSAGVLLLLIVACGNVGNLLLLRASERTNEIAIRTALGVTAGRLVRQLVTESLLLAAVGGLLGVGLAWAAVGVFVRVGPAELPRLAEAAVDGRTVVAALVLVLISAAVFSLVPVWQLLRRDRPSVASGAGRHTSGAATWRARSTLVGANVAMAGILLVGSGLLVRSVVGLLAVQPGFTAEHVLTLQLSLNGPKYSSGDNATDVAAAVRYYEDALMRIQALPGVESAAAVTTLPMGGGVDGYGLHVVGRPMANPEAAPSADRFVVTPGYFRTLDVPLIRGRLLDASDRQGGPATTVINEKLARAEFGLADAIGRQIRLGPPNAVPRTIVGIVGDVRHQGLDATPNYQVYVPQAQWVWAETALTIVVRVDGDPLLSAMPIRTLLFDIDPSQPVTDVRAYADIVAATTATRRVSAWLLAGFAAVALTLAIVGLYGALGVLVGQRRHEIGVRMALGASAMDIGRRVVSQGMRPSMVGLLLGMATAGVLAGAIRSQLFGVSELDPMTFAVAGLVLLGAALLACAIPAWRASRINPVTALRAE